MAPSGRWNADRLQHALLKSRKTLWSPSRPVCPIRIPTFQPRNLQERRSGVINLRIYHQLHPKRQSKVFVLRGSRTSFTGLRPFRDCLALRPCATTRRRHTRRDLGKTSVNRPRCYGPRQCLLPGEAGRIPRNRDLCMFIHSFCILLAL